MNKQIIVHVGDIVYAGTGKELERHQTQKRFPTCHSMVFRRVDLKL
jgi:hypothetical protein